MNNKTKKGKIAIISCLAFFLVAIIAIASVGIYASRNRRQPNVIEVVNPISWSIDEWDGESASDSEWYYSSSFGDRGSYEFTIDSAESFIYFVNLVNDPARSAEYDYFRGYTIYLNRSIDLKGHTIESIGKRLNTLSDSCTFQGTFDGSYYTIYNANIEGNGLFGFVENATIRNIGLYNCTINSTEEYTGGIVGYAVNSQISNTYVRLGSVNGTDVVGGIVGQILSTSGMYGVEYSFADTTLNGEIVGGIVGFGNANHSSMNNVDVGNSYYTGEYKVYGKTDSDFVSYGNIIKANNISQFSAWDYSSKYNLDTRWCDYSNIYGSERLDFDYPILSAFNKVFLTGSYYESTIFNENTGMSENFSSLSSAFERAGEIGTATVNIIVEGVYVDATAVASDSSDITLTSSVNTTIYRGTSNPEIIIVGAEDSILRLGSKDSTFSITFDGNRDYVESNDLKTGVLVYAQGKDFTMYGNITLKNNINNISDSSYGGALYLYGLQAGNTSDNSGHVTINGGTIENCSASAGGGFAVVGTNVIVYNMTVSNCTGSGAYFSDIIEDVNTYEQTLASKYSSTTVDNSNREYDFQTISCIISGNSGAYKSYEYKGDIWEGQFGGGIFAFIDHTPATLTINGGLISENSAEYGGGVASVSSMEYDDTAMPEDYDVKLNVINESTETATISAVSTGANARVANAFITQNLATYDGGGIYSTNTTLGSSASTYSANNAISTMAVNIDPNITIANGGAGTYAVQIYKITFYYKSTNSSVRVSRGSYPSPPSGSTSGYGAVNFVGWATSTATRTTTSISRATSNKNYYAVYYQTTSTPQYTITLNLYTGSGSPIKRTNRLMMEVMQYSNWSGTPNLGTVTASHGPITVSYSGTPSKSGYSFEGWSSSSSGTSANSSASVTVSTATSDKTYSRYAVWSKTGSYTSTTTLRHTYYISSGSRSTTSTVTYRYTGATIYYNYSLSSSRRSGGTLSSTSYGSVSLPSGPYGWSTSSTGTSNNADTTPSSSTTYYAVYRDYNSGTDYDSNTHRFYTDDGDYTTTSNSRSRSYSQTVYYNYNYTRTRYGSTSYGSWGSWSTISYRTATKSGYTFKGWTTSSTSTSASWTSGTKRPSSATYYYAVWQDDDVTTTGSSSLTHRFYTASGDYDTVNSSVSITYSGGVVNYNYNLSYNSTISNGTPSKSYGTISYQSATKNGYTLAGWTTSSTSNTATWTSGTQRPTSNTYYYAVWRDSNGTREGTASTITISFNNGSSTTTENPSGTVTYTGVTRYFSYDLSSSRTLTYGGTAGTPVYESTAYRTATKSGYTFRGWTTSSTATSASWTAGARNHSSSTTYYAVWSNTSGTRSEVSSFEVDFMTGSSSTDTTNTVTVTTPYTGVTKYFNYDLSRSNTLSTGGTAGSPSYSTLAYKSASKSGYTFMGWDTNASTYDADWTSGNKTVTSATTFYAVWKSNTTNSREVTGSPATGTGSYTVSFNGNTNTGGSTSSVTGTIDYTYKRTQNYKLQYNYNLTSSKEVDSSYGSNSLDTTTYNEITLPDNGFTKTGYHFDHWALGSATGTAYNEGDAYTGSGNTTFYAIWEIDTFLVSVAVNGTGSVSPTSIANVPYGSAISVDENTLTINGTTVTATPGSGYRFTSWSNANGTITANRTITANFELADFTVTLNKQGGTGGDSSVIATYGQAMPTITPPTRDGYIFGGYFIDSECNGAQYYNADGTSARNYDITSETTLYAKWTAIDYTVAFDKNFSVSGSSSEANWGTMANINATYDEDIKLISNAFKRNGYSFLGWARSSTASSATYANGATVRNLTTKNGDTVTLYAVWRVENHTVTYDTNGGANINSTNGNFGSTITLPTPTRTGYSFAGWVETADLLGDGSTFARVFYHDVQGGAQLFTSVSEARSTNSQYKYSILNDLSKFLLDGKYTFILEYEYANGHNYWSQTSNPLDEYKATGTPTTATGYQAIDIDWDANYWGGLTRQNSNISTMSSTLLSGSVGHSNWFYAIGVYSVQQAGMPSASDITVQGKSGSTSYGVSLWVKIDDLALVSSNLTQLLGNSTYYIRNTDTALTALWSANTYNINYYDQGGQAFSGTHESGYPTTHTYGTATTLKGASKTGYDFAGWYTNAGCTGSPITTIGATAYSSNITLYAKWNAKTYTITTGKDANTNSVTAPATGTFNSGLTFSWSANSTTAQYEYELYRVRVFSGNSTSGTLLATYTSGTSATFTMTGTYYSSIYIYVEHTAIVRTYTITIQSNNTDRGTVNRTSIQDVEYGDTIALAVSGDNGTLTVDGVTVSATAKVGYHLGSWSGATNNTTVTGNLTITAVFEPDTDTPYIVRHYQQNIENDNYTLFTTENKTGTTGAQVTPGVKSYTGFTSPSTQTITIAANGKSVVNYYYDRIVYKLALTAGTGIASVSGAGNYKYGAEVTINATLATGYNWHRWTGDRTITTQSATIEITGNINLTANGQLKTFVVSIVAGNGGSVNKTSVTVDYGTNVSANDNVLTIGSYIITATANTGYEFDQFIGIPQNSTITSAITITAKFAKTINVTIEVEGNTNSGESFGIDVNGEKYTDDAIVRSGSTIKIEGQTRAENVAENDYQIVSVYRGEDLIVGPYSGTINNITGTNLGTVEEDITIRFVFEDGYKIAVSVTDEEDSTGVTIEADRSTLDGIIAESSDVTITVDPSTITGGAGGREYLGVIYTLDGQQYSTGSDGNDDFTRITTGDGKYVYKLNKVVDEIEIIVKTTIGITVNLQSSEVINLVSEDGFIRVLNNESTDYRIYSSKWKIEAQFALDNERLESIFGDFYTSIQQIEGQYYLII